MGIKFSYLSTTHYSPERNQLLIPTEINFDLLLLLAVDNYSVDHQPEIAEKCKDNSHEQLDLNQVPPFLFRSCTDRII